MKRENSQNFLNEICENCGLTYGSHCATTHYSKHYKIHVPRHACPGHEGKMDWDNGLGTVFKPTGIYRR